MKLHLRPPLAILFYFIVNSIISYPLMAHEIHKTTPALGQAKLKNHFSGQWHIRLCNSNKITNCSEFTVYLTQVGNRLCGDHFFSSPDGGGINEGAPRSVIGHIKKNNIANITITSGRNGNVFRVRAIRNRENLIWNVVGETQRRQESDSALVLTSGVLTREPEDIQYQAALLACQEQ
ncbi:hypothetical protein [Oryzomicrobium sp.]|uniref:hypothetical protein n=1 Tax=Oryzomicrobium sp. TaxID=1911578 RepID=UPI0025EF03E2|nr:hypothetical protein [Oryzomicrobium sp.]MCE1241702.1 hypothetical protein [Oryzomicrobium sp.]